MSELEKRARKENKTIGEHSKTVESTEEHNALLEEIKAQGGEVIATIPVVGKGLFTVQYRVLQD